MKGRPASHAPGGPPRVLLAALGLAVVAGFVWLVRLPPAVVKPPGSAESGVFLTPPPLSEEANEHLQEEMALLDPTPLFLPTRWNSGGAAVPRAEQQLSASSFRDFGPWYAFSEDDPAVSFKLGSEPPASALEAVPLMRPDAGPAGLVLGRRDEPVRPLGRRAGWIEIATAADGVIRVQDDLRLGAGSSLGDDVLWMPVDLVVAVAKSGMVGRPMLLGSTGDERMDGMLPELIARDRRILGLLSPGIYRISVGR